MVGDINNSLFTNLIKCKYILRKQYYLKKIVEVTAKIAHVGSAVQMEAKTGYFLGAGAWAGNN